MGGEAVLNKGALPSVCVIRLDPQDSGYKFPPASPTLTFREDNTVVVQWKDCVVDWAYSRPDRGLEGPVLSLNVLDRRAHWANRFISGEYNIRNEDGSIAKKKSIRELCELCLEALDEDQFQIDGMAAEVWPHVNWDDSPAGGELAALCDLVAFDIVPDWTSNTIDLVGRGSGTNIDKEDNARVHDAYAVRTSRIPNRVVVVPGPDVFQWWIKLIAVGQNPDGRIVPIDDLSYKPVGGWESQWPTAFVDVAAEHRHYAKQSVYRWFQVEVFASTNDLIVDGVELSEISEILPLLPRLAEGGVPASLGYTAPPHQFRGTYCPMLDLLCTTEDDTPGYWDCDIDLEQGLYKFHEPLFYIDTGGEVKAAELDALATFSVHLEDGPVRSTYPHPVRGGVTGDKELRRPDLHRIRGGTTDNSAAIQAEAEAYANSWRASYLPYDGLDIILDGIYDKKLTGKVEQIMWKTGRGDFPFTRLSSGRGFTDMTFWERRRLERAETSAHNAGKGD